jgi:hypothetical protein
MALHSSDSRMLRAEQARAMAENMHDQVDKQTMMEVVAICRKMAGYMRSPEKKVGKSVDIAC